MMVAWLQDWLSLLIRWGHVITGIAWIGASFYFNWLENHLERLNRDPAIAGDLWAVHGGGFYFLQKYEVAPPSEPPNLHWFKWEAYTTWLSGIALLIVVYYVDASLMMIDPEVAKLSAVKAILIGVASLVLSWLVYDLLCRSPLASRQSVLAAVVFAWFVLLAWVLGEILSGRAAYIHTGAAIGTVMVANVFRVIIPAQKELVTALRETREPDGRMGRKALQRSRHNNYFTLPVLFIMISGHYPATYGHQQAWLILVILSMGGVSVRHYFNIRHRDGNKAAWLMIALVLLSAAAWWARPQHPAAPGEQTGAVGIDAAWDIVQRRCTACHAEQPTYAGFNAPPLGVELDSVDKLRAQAERVYSVTVLNRTMPLANMTGMSEPERGQIALWFEALESGKATQEGEQ